MKGFKMIAPHELKNKTFSRAFNGYSPVEVDQYFDFLIEKYTEAYKSAFELEQKFNAIEAKYLELANEEESIRSAILKAQKLGEAIVNNAKKDAAEKEQDLIERCDAIIAAAKEKVEEEKRNIEKLRKMAIDFQHKLYEDYVRHVEMIRDMKLDELPTPDQVLKDDEAFQDAKREALDGKDFSIIAPTEADGVSKKDNQ
jgi:cell division initiation protein